MSTQSLPSFAQAFSDSSLSNALPPIMTRKRHQDDDDDEYVSSLEPRAPLTPTSVSVKQETHDPDDAAPAPSALMPPSPKKRRITVSGAPQSLHIDVAPASSTNAAHHPGSTPISPVVMGFTIQGNKHAAIDAVRNMINVKQQQKALIEQRRGDVAGQPLSPGHQGARSPVDERAPQLSQNSSGTSASGSTPRTRRSPNNGSRRLNNSSQRPPSPQMTPQHVHPAQQQPSHHTRSQQSQSSQQQGQQSQPGSQQGPQQPTPPAPQHSLPPPPISFAQRRAALLGGKKKPADIVISPRSSHSREQLQPTIMSAPPVVLQGGSYATHQQHPPGYADRAIPSISRTGVPSTATFSTMSMALPRLPSMTGGTERRVAGNVPPTPTRLSMLQHAAQHQQQHEAQGSQGSIPVNARASSSNHPGNGGGPSGLSLHPPPMGPGASISGGSSNRSPPATRSPPASIPIATSLVPPTPTSLVHNTNNSSNAAAHPGHQHLAGPGTAGPIALPRTPGIPQTPATLARPGGPYSRMPGAASASSAPSGSASEAMMGPNEKAAFLAPFEVFYDALADARQLKNWLGEQLRDSRAALATFDRRVDDKVAGVVDRRVEERLAGALARERDFYDRRIEAVEVAFARERDSWEKTVVRERQGMERMMEEMRAEVGSLRARVRELEDSAGGSSSSHHHALGGGGGRRPMHKTNGTASPMPAPQQDGYSFPSQQGASGSAGGVGNDDGSATSRLHSTISERPPLSRRASSPAQHRGMSPDPRDRERERERSASERAERQRDMDAGRDREMREWERQQERRGGERERERRGPPPRDYHNDYSDHDMRDRESARGGRESDADRERQSSMDVVHEDQGRMTVDTDPVVNGSSSAASKGKSKTS